MRIRAALLFLACVSLAAQTGPGGKILVRGAYATPKPFWDRGARLDDYAINSVFVHRGSVTRELVERANAEGAKVYAEFPTLNGRDYVEKHPEAWPINEKGEKAPPATWFLGVCPTEPGFKAHRLKQLVELLDHHDVAGVWMDYFHWHAQFEEPEPILPETCFNDTCLAAFQAATGIKVPTGTLAEKAAWILARHDRAWRDWRVSVLVEWARDFREIIRQKRPDVLLGVYHCPWKDEEFGGALRRVLGLDFDRLAGHVDVFSPMVYHGRMGRSPEWVGEYGSWLTRRLNLSRGVAPLLWPIVQAHGEPRVISAEEFEQVMKLGTSGAATGIMMFTLRSVAEDDGKMEALRRLYRGWAQEAAHGGSN